MQEMAEYAEKLAASEPGANKARIFKQRFYIRREKCHRVTFAPAIIEPGKRARGALFEPSMVNKPLC
jgi:hypothetical protein